jgi:hypothetical protein
MATEIKVSDVTRKRPKVYLQEDVIKFKMYLMRGDKEEETFGGGAVKKEDLGIVVQSLFEFYRELELSGAREEGYREAVEDLEDENEEYNDNQDDDEQDDE